MEPVDYVNAVFGGKRVQFKLSNERDARLSLESTIGPPMETLRRFVVFAWKTTDVEHILKHAYPNVWLCYQFTNCPAVDDALRTGRFGTYAPLAHKLLEAFIFGLPVERATFDENNPFPTPATTVGAP